MGLSCASCHPSGRANPQFYVQQISDQPGRADISHHFLSSQGGDQLFNPKSIPDLANVSSLRIKDRASAEFDALLTQLIEVEFDGSPPTVEVFSALRHYLSQNDSNNCDYPSALLSRSVELDWILINDGLAALEYAIKMNDMSTARFIQTSMRSVLESFYRFYSIRPVDTVDKTLIDISRVLDSPLGSSNSINSAQNLAALSASLSNLKQQLDRYQSISFYNPKRALEYLRKSE
jgi:hypothetical protein